MIASVRDGKLEAADAFPFTAALYHTLYLHTEHAITIAHLTRARYHPATFSGMKQASSLWLLPFEYFNERFIASSPVAHSLALLVDPERPPAVLILSSLGRFF